MVDYTSIMIARHEHHELGRQRPAVEGIRIAAAGPLRRGLAGLGSLLATVGHRLQGPAEPLRTRPTAAGSGD